MSKFTGDQSSFIIVLSIFVGCITIASVLANKIISVFGLFVPAGVLAYSITFIMTDAISEIWGKQTAKRAVFGGFIGLIVVLLLIQISVLWPKAPFWKQEAAYHTIMGSTSRIIIASFIAYLVSQFHDVWAFHFWRKITGGRHLWLRNNLSTAVSQFIDSALFITVAFYGIMPVWPLIWSQWLVKLGIAFLDTPFIYGIVWLIRKSGR